jgi:urease accessory protein
MRPGRPWCFTNLRSGEGLEQVVDFLSQQIPLRESGEIIGDR